MQVIFTMLQLQFSSILRTQKILKERINISKVLGEPTTIEG